MPPVSFHHVGPFCLALESLVHLAPLAPLYALIMMDDDNFQSTLQSYTHTRIGSFAVVSIYGFCPLNRELSFYLPSM